jgi:DNA-binding transcriptional LysR family regulator
MRLSLRQLQIFCAVAQYGSTTRAGEAVALSQSATSAALNELEAGLGTQLFDRAGKRLRLNDVGEGLLPQAKKLLEGALEIEARFHSDTDQMKTRLRIGCSTTIGNYVLPRILGELRQSFPSLRVDIEMGNSLAIAGKVADFDVDMGLIEGPCHLAELRSEPWLVDTLQVVAGMQHPLAKKTRLVLDDLSGAEWLLREPGSGTREEVEHLLLRHLHGISDTRQVGSSEAIKQMLAAGIGISCLSQWVIADMVATQRLKVLEVLPPLTRRFFMIRHNEKFISPGLACFWDACSQFSH